MILATMTIWWKGIMKKQRLEYVDLLKTVGILFMILGHVQFGDYFDVYVHSFHMPLFFFISGFLFNLDRNKVGSVYAGKKIKSLLMPYLLWGALYEVIGYIMNIGQLKSFIFNNIYEVPIGGAIWFLTALFFTELIGYVLIKFTKSYIGFAISIFLVIVIRFAGFNLPLSIDSALVGTIFYLVGYYCREYILETYKKILSNKMLTTAVILALIIVSILVAMYTPLVSMRTNEYGNVFRFFMIAIVLTTLWFFVCYMLSASLKNEKIMRGLTYIGRNSITFVCVNQLVILCINKVVAFVFGSACIYSFLYKIVETILVLLVCCMIDNTLNLGILKVLKGKSISTNL